MCIKTSFDCTLFFSILTEGCQFLVDSLVIAIRAYNDPRRYRHSRLTLIPPLNLLHQAVGIDSFSILEMTTGRFKRLFFVSLHLQFSETISRTLKTAFIGISLVLMVRQRITGRAKLSHAGHLGGMFGGGVAEVNRQYRR